MADPVNPFTPADLAKYKQFFKPQERPNVLGTPAGQQALETEKSGLSSFLGATDYGQQLEESRDQAKLQFYLNMAQRGFAAAGAAPLQGESLVSTLSRELLSPLAGDAGAVASRMMQQRQALKAAERQEERQLKLAALQNVQGRQEKAFADDASATQQARNYMQNALKRNDTVSNEYMVNGKTVPLILRKDHTGQFQGFFKLDGTKVNSAEVTIKPVAAVKPITSWASDVQVKPVGGSDDQFRDAPGALKIADGTGKNSRVVLRGLTLDFDPKSATYNAKIVNKKSDQSAFYNPTSKSVFLSQPAIDLFNLPQNLLGQKATYREYLVKPERRDLNSQSIKELSIAGGTFVFNSHPGHDPETGNITVKRGPDMTPEIFEATQLFREQDPKATDTGTYTGNLVVVDTNTGKPVLDAQQRRIQVARRGNELFQLGSTVVYKQPSNTELVPVAKFDAEESDPTDTARKITANRDLLFTSMYGIQNQQLQGANTPFGAESALYFDVAAYRAGEFAFKYVPPGTNPLEAAAESVTITNPGVQNFITKRVNSLADATLRTDFGSANQEIKPARLNDAVKAILSLSPAALFGAEAIPNLGTDANNNPVGYVPGASALDPAIQREVVKTAVDVLKRDPTANPTEIYRGIAFPASKEALNKTYSRVKIATTIFPEAFGNPEVAGTDNFDFDLVQQRMDIEVILPRANLVLGASTDDYRKVLTDEAAKVSVARDKLQNGTNARSAKESFLLFRQFREGLLDFKNAARESKVEGFFTGRLTSGLSRLGLAKFISGEGAEHWNRLTAASDRFQEGISRRVGKDFGDDRISNLDAAAYQKLVADIKKGKDFNRILVDDGLSRIKNNLTDLMSRGGRVGWTERELRQASEAGVDFSELKTMENWHGHGYYGKDRYSATRQQTPSLSQNQRDVIRTQGQLKDTMYGGQYTVPDVNYLRDELPTFQRETAATKDRPEISATEVLRKGPLQFDDYIKELADKADVSVDVMRRRVVQGIISYNTFRAQIR